MKISRGWTVIGLLQTGSVALIALAMLAVLPIRTQAQSYGDNDQNYSQQDQDAAPSDQGYSQQDQDQDDQGPRGSHHREARGYSSEDSEPGDSYSDPQQQDQQDPGQDQQGENQEQSDR